MEGCSKITTLLQFSLKKQHLTRYIVEKFRWNEISFVRKIVIFFLILGTNPC